MSMVLIWVIVCIAAVLIELATPTALVSIWFAVGGAIGAIAALIHLPVWTQIVCFVVVSLVSMLIVRPVATRYLRGNVIATNADRCIGSIAVVTKKLSKEEWGEVKVSGSLWHAVPVDDEVIEEEEKVKIIAIEGAKLLVKRVI
ncbi:NfeD family protein [Amedibacillus sp. YH-ame10]